MTTKEMLGPPPAPEEDAAPIFARAKEAFVPTALSSSAWISANEKCIALLREAAQRPRCSTGRDELEDLRDAAWERLDATLEPLTGAEIDRLLVAASVLRAQAGDGDGAIELHCLRVRAQRVIHSEVARLGGDVLSHEKPERLAAIAREARPSERALRELQRELAGAGGTWDDAVRLLHYLRLSRTRFFGDIRAGRLDDWQQELVESDRGSLPYEHPRLYQSLVGRASWLLDRDEAGVLERQLRLEALGRERGRPVPRRCREIDAEVDGGAFSKRSASLPLQHGPSFLRLAVALEIHHLRHGEYPERLDQLVPDVVPELPSDCCAEEGPHRYRRERDGYSLWSVAENGRDDGGVRDLARGLDDEVVRVRR